MTARLEHGKSASLAILTSVLLCAMSGAESVPPVMIGKRLELSNGVRNVCGIFHEVMPVRGDNKTTSAYVSFYLTTAKAISLKPDEAANIAKALGGGKAENDSGNEILADYGVTYLLSDIDFKKHYLIRKAGNGWRVEEAVMVSEGIFQPSPDAGKIDIVVPRIPIAEDMFVKGHLIHQNSKSSGKGSPSGKGEASDNSGSAPRVPGNPPPAKPGSAPK